MFIYPSRTGMTTMDLVAEIEATKLFKHLEDGKRGLHIFYSEDMLFSKKHIISHPFIDMSVSTNSLKEHFQGNPEDKQEGCNCKNKEALERINNLEKVIDIIINSSTPEKIFDFLPYTKDNKFSKTGAINIYIPNIKNTFNGDYFSQDEISLQVNPLEIADVGIFSGIRSGEIAFLEINPNASFTNKKRPDNIVDEKGNFQKVVLKRNSYLKQDEIVVGTSYIDAKGSEYLYIGGLKENIHYEGIDCRGVPYSGNYKGTYGGLYLRITPKIQKELSKYTTLGDFLYSRFNKILLKEQLEWKKGLNMTFSKKFTNVGNVYFDKTNSKIPKGTLNFVYPKGTYPSEPDFSTIVKLEQIM